MKASIIIAILMISLQFDLWLDVQSSPMQVKKLCLVDSDHDGWYDLDDNCIENGNPRQMDRDLDGIGDICDPCPTVPGNCDSKWIKNYGMI